MLKTYITTVPLQGKLDPMLYQRERAEAPTATCFPIVQVMRDTLEPGDTVQLLAIRQENADTARNYQRLLEELTQLGIAENQVRQLHLPEDQRPETLIGLCRDLVDALPQVTRVYACITYGSKSIPVVTLTALTCAEATHTELEVGGVYMVRSSGKTDRCQRAALRYGSAVSACRTGRHHVRQQDRRTSVPSADLDERAPGGLSSDE